jgi:hypothetical protein
MPEFKENTDFKMKNMAYWKDKHDSSPNKFTETVAESTGVKKPIKHKAVKTKKHVTLPSGTKIPKMPGINSANKKKSVVYDPAKKRIEAHLRSNSFARGIKGIADSVKALKKRT